MSTDVYALLTATSLTQLETADLAVWSPPSHGADLWPINAPTGCRYGGLNLGTLWKPAQTRGYADPRWATYRQWTSLGTPIQRGELASPTPFYRERSAGAEEDPNLRAQATLAVYQQVAA